MKKLLKSTFLILLAVLFFSLPACSNKDELAGTVYDPYRRQISSSYIQISTIEGECLTSKHPKWIEVLDFSFGVDTPEKSFGGEFTPFTFTHKVDIATPKIEECILRDRVISSVKFNYCEPVAGKEETLIDANMEEIKMVSSEIDIDENGNLIETVQFVYKRITLNCWTVENSMLFHNKESRLQSREFFDYSGENTGIEKFELPTKLNYTYYLNTDFTYGEFSDTRDHEDWLKVLDCSLGSLLTIDKGVVVAKEFKPLTFVHVADSNSAKIFDLAKSNAPIQNIELHATKAIAGKEETVFKVKLKNSTITKNVIYLTEDQQAVEFVSIIPEEAEMSVLKVNFDNSIGAWTTTFLKINQD